jgi:hypothetical protein
MLSVFAVYNYIIRVGDGGGLAVMGTTFEDGINSLGPYVTIFAIVFFYYIWRKAFFSSGGPKPEKIHCYHFVFASTLQRSCLEN